MEYEWNSSNETVSIEVDPALLYEISPAAHYIYGTILTTIGTAGVLGNGLVLIVFTRYRRLKGPFSCFIINLAIADLITSILHFMSAISAFQHRWIFGPAALAAPLKKPTSGGSSFNSADSHSLTYLPPGLRWKLRMKSRLSEQRKSTRNHFEVIGYSALNDVQIRSPLRQKLDVVLLEWNFSFQPFDFVCVRNINMGFNAESFFVSQVCVMAWIYCLLMTLPPLFGWSRYILEGFLTSCSWDYMTRTPANRAYYVYLLFFGFVIPVSIITYCYTFILITILAHGKEMANIKATGGGGYSLSSRIPVPHTPARSTVKTAEIILMLVVLFLVAWTPYAVVTLIGQFGNPLLITPWVSALPALFAKASVVYNPIVYSLSHPHFRSSVLQYISSCTGSMGADHRTAVIGCGGAPLGLNRENMTSMRGIASSPTRLGHLHSHHHHHHHASHHVHFRCFPARRLSPNICADFHSEPDPARVAVLLDQQGAAMTLRWTDRLPRARGMREGASLQNTSITSEAMVTVVNSQSTASGRPTVCFLYNTMPERRSQKHSKFPLNVFNK
nr:PREDICTED: rhodopsin, GQ-coupled-like [Bemisia tabaci]